MPSDSAALGRALWRAGPDRGRRQKITPPRRFDEQAVANACQNYGRLAYIAMNQAHGSRYEAIDTPTSLVCALSSSSRHIQWQNGFLFSSRLGSPGLETRRRPRLRVLAWYAPLRGRLCRRPSPRRRDRQARMGRSRHESGLHSRARRVLLKRVS